MKRAHFYAVAVAMAAGCSGSSGGTSPGDGGGGDGGGTEGGIDASSDAGSDVGSDVTDAGAMATCADYANAQCNFLQMCQPGNLQADHGTMAQCVMDVTANCMLDSGAPRTGETQAWLNACTTALSKAKCDPHVPAPGDACQIVGGGTAGESCGVAAQCASDVCARSPGQLCGTCTAIGKAGDACGSGVSYDRGLVCSPAHKCVTVVGNGAACDRGATNECVTGTDCVLGDAGAGMGTCMRTGNTAGAACSRTAIGSPRCDAAAGFFCNAGQCAAITYVATSAACGLAPTTDNVCTGGDECVGGTCDARIASGMACTVGAAPTCANSVCVTGDGGAGGTCTTIDPTCTAPDGGSGMLAFQPSNVKIADVTAQAPMAQDEDVAGSCGVTTDTTTPITDCFGSPIVTAKQPDGTTVNLIVVHSLVLEPTASMRVNGTVPLVIVSLTSATLGGIVDAHSTDLTYGPGAFGPSNVNMAGQGPGGGPAASGATTVGAGGGSFCGLGGPGGGTAAQGMTYGTADLRPLIGGSAGGGGTVGGPAGGGAVQFSAEGALTVPAGGSITAGGQGSFSGGGATDQNAGGGGAGGAILLEGTSVTVAGILAANGGGGGGGKDGSDSTADATAAPGGAGNAGVAAGGSGAAGATIAGAAGSAAGGKNSGGGGGGAGYLRINTSNGMATVTGATLSPSAATSCYSLGMVRGLMAGP